MSRVRFGHESLVAYQVGEDLFVRIYDWAAIIPRNDYFLRAQVLRAALSIPSNIAEGYGEFSVAEKVRFYRYARRSAEECTSQIKCIARVRRLPENDVNELLKGLKRAIVLVSALIQSALKRAEQTDVPRDPA